MFWHVSDEQNLYRESENELFDDIAYHQCVPHPLKVAHFLQFGDSAVYHQREQGQEEVRVPPQHQEGANA